MSVVEAPIKSGYYSNKNYGQLLDELAKLLETLVQGEFPSPVNDFVSDKLAVCLPAFLAAVHDGLARDREGEKSLIEKDKEQNLINATKELARAKEELAKAGKKKQELAKERTASEAKSRQLQDDKRRFEKQIEVAAAQQDLTRRNAELDRQMAEAKKADHDLLVEKQKLDEEYKKSLAKNKSGCCG